MVVRRPPSRRIDWEDLKRWSAVTDEGIAVLEALVKAGGGILVGGNAGSGRTTFASLLAGMIPATHRVVAVEQSHEMVISRPRLVRLCIDHRRGQTMTDLLRIATRMRADWIAVNELRGPETAEAFEAARSGYSVLMTMTASSVADALRRTELMCLRSEIGCGLSEIREIAASALSAIAYQKRCSDGKRRLSEIVRVEGTDEGGIRLVPLYRYDEDEDRVVLTNEGRALVSA